MRPNKFCLHIRTLLMHFASWWWPSLSISVFILAMGYGNWSNLWNPDCTPARAKIWSEIIAYFPFFYILQNAYLTLFKANIWTHFKAENHWFGWEFDLKLDKFLVCFGASLYVRMWLRKSTNLNCKRFNVCFDVWLWKKPFCFPGRT